MRVSLLISIMKPVWYSQKKHYKFHDTRRMKYTGTVEVETMKVNMLVTLHQHFAFPVPALFLTFVMVLLEITMCSLRWRRQYNDLQFLGISPPDERLSKY